MSQLIMFGQIGENRDRPRLFVESQRLIPLGFSVGQKVEVIPGAESVIIRVSENGTHTISKRRDAGSVRPVLDINSATALAPLVDHDEFRLNGRNGVFEVRPSVRSFYIRSQRNHSGPFKVMDIFSGGGTMSQAMHGNPVFEVTAGMEIEPKFADVWARLHPDATLIQGDISSIYPEEVPDIDGIIAGIPCTDHSVAGRAKKGLVGEAADTGEFGGLYTHVLTFVRAKRPSFCVFENVTNYGNSRAGQTLRDTLVGMGYHWTTITLEPHSQWGEPSERRRWVGVATLKPGFEIQVPGRQFDSTLKSYLDAPDDALDKHDCERIAGTIECLRAHNARHAAKGNGFSFSTITRESVKCPTVIRSYHKINTGPFVETPFGLRLLRKTELERLLGCNIPVDHFATACEIVGQGVQTRVFREIFNQLGRFLS